MSKLRIIHLACVILAVSASLHFASGESDEETTFNVTTSETDGDGSKDRLLAKREVEDDHITNGKEEEESVDDKKGQVEMTTEIDEGSGDTEEDDEEDEEALKGIETLAEAKAEIVRLKKREDSFMKVFDESMDLAKEVDVLSRKIVKREANVDSEMSTLKDCLTRALESLNNANPPARENIVLSRLRRQNVAPNSPYKACISIHPVTSDRGLMSNNVQDDNIHGQKYSKLTMREFVPTREEAEKMIQATFQNNQGPARPQQERPQTKDQKHRPVPVGPLPMIPRMHKSVGEPSIPLNTLGQQSSGKQAFMPQQGSQKFPRPSTGQNEVDLSEVYWLRLDPKRRQQPLRNRLDNVLKTKQAENKDVLVIPLSHNFQDVNQVKDGFLRAVRVKPAAVRSGKFRQLRSLRIYEI